MKAEWSEIVVALAIVVVLYTMGYFVGLEQGAKDAKREAVRQGHARYVVTDEREVKFEWIEAKEQGN